MATRQDLDRLLEEKQKWVNIYDMCTTCLQYISLEFAGKASANADAYTQLQSVRRGVSGSDGFWQGQDADVFRSKVHELREELAKVETQFERELLKIQKNAENKTNDLNEQIRVCYEEMDWAGNASLLGDAIWDTLTGRGSRS